MAKGTKNNRRTKSKSNRRAQNAFEIAQREENSKYQDDSDSSDDGAIVDPRKKFKEHDEGGSDEEFVDEEIDSDEALGSDDDFDVLNSKFSQTIRDRQKKLKKGELEEEDEDEDEDDGYKSVDESEFLPLSAVWDLDDKDLAKNKDSKDIVLDDQWESESEASEDESDSEDSDDDEDEEEEEFPFDKSDKESEEDEVELTNLKNQLTKKGKRDKRHYQELQVEENELALPGGGQDITLADMLSVVDQDISKKAMLIDQEDEESAKSLAIPLPKRIQERHDRRAAYEISKDEVEKWKDTVKQNREAEVLSFPMNKPVEHNAPSTFQETPALTELEKKINSVLTESSLNDDKKESTFEEIATAKMSVEEMRKRQNELRKMRELMFRNEREAKRIKKIKSKSYRRIKKKEMLKNKLLIEGDESDDEDHDSKRAQERMSLKHKNNSNWSKSMIKSGLSKDKEAREEMEDMLRRGEALKAKILDRDEDEDEFGDSNDLDLDKDIDYESDTETREKLGKTGVLNMAFMKNAEARERTRNEETKRNLRQLEANDDINAFNQAEENSIDKHINSGRRIYTPGAAESSTDMKKVSEEAWEENEIDNEKNLTNRLSKKNKSKSLLSKNKDDSRDLDSQEQNEDQAEQDSNPWLQSSDQQVQKSRKLRITDKDSSKLDKNAAKLNKQRKRKANEIEEPEEIIDMNQTLRVVDPHGDDSDNVSEVDASEIHMFKQQDLIKQAFAGDDVVQEFENEKRQVIKDEGDQIEDLTLPGWGDWAGGKNKKAKKNKIVKKTKGVDFDKRKDKNLKGVIINEKVNKKNAKYQSSAVPFPFENREQYERSLRMPIGQEWTSRETHQRLTMPKVTIKSGVVIDPLKAPFK